MIATMIEKAPEGGYSLKQSVTNAETGETRWEIVCYRTHLPEITAYELGMKTMAFKEVAWGPIPSGQPSMPQPQLQQQPQQHQEQYPDDPTDPDMAKRMAQRFGLNGNGVNAVVAMLFCTAVAMSYSLRSFVT